MTEALELPGQLGIDDSKLAGAIEGGPLGRTDRGRQAVQETVFRGVAKAGTRTILHRGSSGPAEDLMRPTGRVEAV